LESVLWSDSTNWWENFETQSNQALKYGKHGILSNKWWPVLSNSLTKTNENAFKVIACLWMTLN
jgi:hypothetical protein